MTGHTREFSLIQVKMKKRLPFFAFALCYLVFSFATFRDYGCTWDEQDTYQGGADLYQFIVHGAPMAYMDPEHSYPYTFLLSFLTGPSNYEFLHLLNLLFTGFLFWAVYEMLLAEYGDSRTEPVTFFQPAYAEASAGVHARPGGIRRSLPAFSTGEARDIRAKADGNGLWALSGPVFLFLYLPFLGSIPANPKDIPFAVFYFLGLAVLYLYDRKFPELRFRWFFLGLLAAFSISSRIVGFTLFPIIIFYDAYLFWASRDWKDSKAPGKWLKGRALEWAGALVFSQILCCFLWPFIGKDYFRNLVEVLWLGAHFPPKFSFLFMGHMTDSLSYPWYCLPLWILITMPLFLLAYFLGSSFLFKKAKSNHLFTLMASTLALNLGLYFTLHPAIYDGLRHFLFLLPFLSVLASMAFIEFFKGKSWGPARKAAAVLTLAGVFMTAREMVRLHPYEYVYFNELAGGFKGAYGKFETDYWVAGMKEAVRWLEANETREPGRVYKVYADGKPFQSQAYFTPNVVLDPHPDDADYAIIMTRAGVKPGPADDSKVIHRVEREGAPLCFILKMK